MSGRAAVSGNVGRSSQVDKASDRTVLVAARFVVLANYSSACVVVHVVPLAAPAIVASNGRNSSLKGANLS